MLTNDEALSQRINGFMRRKEAKYPELARPINKRERIVKDTYKPARLAHWTLGISTR